MELQQSMDPLEQHDDLGVYVSLYVAARALVRALNRSFLEPAFHVVAEASH